MNESNQAGGFLSNPAITVMAGLLSVPIRPLTSERIISRALSAARSGLVRFGRIRTCEAHGSGCHGAGAGAAGEEAGWPALDSAAVGEVGAPRLSCGKGGGVCLPGAPPW